MHMETADLRQSQLVHPSNICNSTAENIPDVLDAFAHFPVDTSSEITADVPPINTTC